jgi:hypothetical protein
MKKKLKKLNLHAETLRSLDTISLEPAAGAVGTVAGTVCTGQCTECTVVCTVCHLC